MARSASLRDWVSFLSAGIKDGGAVGGLASVHFGILFGFPVRHGAAVGQEPFFAGRAAFFDTVARRSWISS